MLKNDVCLATLFLFLVASAAWAQSSSQPRDIIGGAPLAHARRQAISAVPIRGKLGEAKVRRWMQIASRCTMDEFQLFLEPFSEDEKRFIAKIEKIPPPIVNRLHFEDLRAMLSNGGLLSYEKEEERGKHLKHTTPALENKLYGAYDCVFASIGPPNGSPRYGDVIIRLRDSVRERGWATPFSGMHFIYAVRHKDARKMQSLLAAGKALPGPPSPLSLGFDDRLHFSHNIVTEDAWSRALAYQAIAVLRNADDSPAGDHVRARFKLLLTVDDAKLFWTVFIPARDPKLPAEEAAARIPFGYLEGKFTDQLSIADLNSIEVPAEKLEEVRAWPVAKKYRELIRAKAKGVP